MSALHPWGGQGAGAVSLELGMKCEVMATLLHHPHLPGSILLSFYLYVKPRWLVHFCELRTWEFKTSLGDIDPGVSVFACVYGCVCTYAPPRYEHGCSCQKLSLGVILQVSSILCVFMYVNIGATCHDTHVEDRGQPQGSVFIFHLV